MAIANIGPPTALKKLFVIDGLAHAFTLRPLMASAHYVVCPSKATKAGKKRLQNSSSRARAVTQAEYDLSSNIADAVHNHPLASKLLSFGTPELSFFTQDKKSGIEVKARPSWLVGSLIVFKNYRERCVARKSNKNYCKPQLPYTSCTLPRTVQAKNLILFLLKKVYPFAVGIYKLD